MKKISYIVLPVAILFAGCSAMIQTTAYQPQPQPVYTDNFDNTNYQTDQVFYDELSPYGTWVNYPDYGYVWVPDVDSDFRPYVSNGYWVYSDYGWTWVSNYIWGWAPFHYGRWFQDDYYGWVWVPGHEWAPAWVTWGSYDDYFCWAPIAPRVDMDYVSSGRWYPAANSWNVVSGRNITQVNVVNYVQHNTMVVNHITVINNVNSYGGNDNRPGNNRGYNGRVIYNRGPQVGIVESKTHATIRPVTITNNARPGAQVLSNNQVSFYRPAIRQGTPQGNNQPVPKRVEAYRPTNEPNRQHQTRPGSSQYPVQNQQPNVQQQRPLFNRPNDNQNQQPNVQQQRPQFNRPNDNQNQQPNVQQQRPQFNRPNDNQNQQPNVQQQRPQFNRPNDNQNQRPNVQQQRPQFNRPNDNQNQQPNVQQQQNGQGQKQIHGRPGYNQPPAQNLNMRPGNQNAIPGLNPNAPKKRQPQPNAKPDTSKRGRPVQIIKS